MKVSDVSRRFLKCLEGSNWFMVHGRFCKDSGKVQEEFREDSGEIQGRSSQGRFREDSGKVQGISESFD